MEREIIKSIKSLPVISDTIRQIQRVCGDPNSSMADMIKVVEKDPVLTVNLLRAANSPLYGFSREVSNIAQAVSLFGMSTIKGFAIVTAVKSRMKINLSPYGLSENDFLKTAEIQNAFMVRWMLQADRNSLDLLAPASFSLEIGVLILSAVIVQQGKQKEFLESLEGRGSRSVASVEREFFGMSSYHATSVLFEYWNFDETLMNVMKYVENPEKAPKNLSRYAYILAVLQRLISLYQVCSEEQIQEARNILAHAHFPEDLHFEQVLSEFMQNLQTQRDALA